MAGAGATRSCLLLLAHLGKGVCGKGSLGFPTSVELMS